MNSMKWVIAAVVGTLVLAPLPVLAQKAGQDGYQVGQRLGQTGKAGAGRFREISWDDLIPADWNPEKFFLDLNLNDLQDNDPRAAEVMQKIREEWDRAPLVQRFNGERIRIPGFIVPLETDGKTIREFLLVPYFGACVHVPPPPANQLIHVMPDKPVSAKLDMLPVWVSGVLNVARFESDLGNAGYLLRAITVEEYKEPMPR
ncbi:MAG: DUF3299 domain-containing protein [Azoarcus sp.]|nr:MAG: DUF3299 domain-containing protein [Azoarcus sp.]TVT53951.1 MAG: DUF3299 domain-containing protein [Azoarcus sp. PHD]